jgi:hypothetical protein
MRWRRRGLTAVFDSTAIAATPLRRTCPIRIISLQLLGDAGALLRVFFLDREGLISAKPHYVPLEDTLNLAANQQRVLGGSECSEACSAASPLGYLRHGCVAGWVNLRC